MNIEGRRILITGASRGLGRTLALSFAAAGAKEVLAGARQPEHIEKSHPAITPIRLDVTSDDDVAATRTLGPIDMLVNNAGVAGYGNPITMDFEAALAEMNINYFGALRMARALAPAMIERREGMVVNVATAFAKINLPIVATYCASKAALLSLGQALRAYLGDHGVHVMTVMPTTIDTDMSKGADVPKMTPEFVAAEIVRHIRDESIDPPIGAEAEGVLSQLQSNPAELAAALSKIRA